MLIEILTYELGKFMDYLIEESAKELRAQGHVLTGASIKAIKKEILPSLTGPSIARIHVPDHLIILDRGVHASRVPFTPNSGNPHSKYIAKLIEWLGKRGKGATYQERRSIAIRIAKSAIKHRHPTPGARKYSSNGRRTNWSKFAIENNISRGAEIIDFVSITNAMVSDFEAQIKAA